MSDIDKEVLDAYKVDNWTQMVRLQDPIQPWFPIYTERNKWTSSDPAGIASQNMQEVKMQWLPKVIMGGPAAYEQNWEDYMTAYDSQIDYKAFEDTLTKEVKRRVEIEKELEAKVDK